MAGDQRRRHDHAALGRANNQPFLEAQGAAAPGDIALIGEAFATGFVLGELQGGDQADALNITHQRVLAEGLAQQRLQVRARVGFHPSDDLLITQCLQRGDGHGGGYRVAGIGQAVGEHAALIDQRRSDAFAQHQATHGDVTRSQALSDGQGVRLEIEVLVGEPFAGAAKAANHFVGAQQHVVLPADALNFRPVTFWREDHPARALEGFGDKTGDVLGTQLEDFRLQLQGAAAAEFRRGQVAALGVPVGFVDVGDVRDHAAHLVHKTHAAECGAGQGRAVVAVPAADHDLLLRLPLDLPEAPHGADQRLVGLGAGVGVNRVAVVRRQQAEQQLGQLDHRRVGGVEEQVVIRQLLHLPGRGGVQVLAPVTEAGAPQPRHAIQVALAVVVPQVQALALDDHPRAFGVQRLLVEKGVDMVRRIQGLIVGGGTAGGHRHCHRKGPRVPILSAAGTK